MELIGLLDSPYVRRVAISLQLLGLPFAHRPISVFRHLDAFREINPVVKAPTLICADGGTLMDSTLILDHAESLANGRSLMPIEPSERLGVLRRIGLALAACEKAVQIVYERSLRPAEKQHQPWIDRVGTQLLAACDELDRQFAAAEPPASATIRQDALTAAVAWHFMHLALPDRLDTARFPALVRLSEAAERLPEFQDSPHGDGVSRAAVAVG